MITITDNDRPALIHNAPAEGIVLTMCDEFGNAIGNLYGPDVPKDPADAFLMGDISMALSLDRSGWIVAAHTELGAIFLDMFEKGELSS